MKQRNVIHHRSRSCDQCKNSAMQSTTGAGAAINARAGATYFTTGESCGRAQRQPTRITTYFTSNASTTNKAKSSRVPGPTVDRRVSVNSGAERVGATTLCHGMCLHQNRCEDETACLGEWSSNVPDIVEPTDPLAPTKPLTVTKTPAADTKPSLTSAKK